ncbi:MAG: hypothetical protein HWD80_00790 [Flavobacteriaceae bacterium]|nr:hypothetical protein [Flavobacteriaceae bacterium]
MNHKKQEVKDLFNALIDTSKERIRNPFVGTFLLSWLFFNWKAFVTLFFSSLELEQRISIIESSYYSLKYTLWIPLILATFYVGILPYIMAFIDYISKWGWRWRKESMTDQKIFDIQEKQRIAQEENILETIKANYRDKADLNIKIEQITQQLNESHEISNELQETVENLMKERESLIERLETSKSKLSNSEIDRLEGEYEKFKNSEMFEYFSSIGSSVSRYNSIPNNLDHLVLEKFIQTGIIKESRDDDHERITYHFTKEGEYFWRKYVLSAPLNKHSNEQEDSDDLPF